MSIAEMAAALGPVVLTALSRKLKEQIERIIDEGGGERQSVIVQMASPDEEKKDDVVQKVSEVMRKRSLSLNPRDTLPVSLEKMLQAEAAKPSSATLRQLRAAEGSASAQVAMIAQPALTKAVQRNAGRRALKPLLTSELVRTATREDIPHFWTSKSALLQLNKDELAKLPAVVPEVRDIRLNRQLRLPPLVEVKNLPLAVQENKTSAWGIHSTGALAAWGAYGARGQGIKIGLLDTGVDPEHPDLKGKVAAWAEFDAEGKEVQGSQPHDSHQHGTHCAGILVGQKESGQWIGMAPEARIAAALVLNGDKGGTDAQILAGLEWAIEQEVDVISMSLGGLSFDPETPPTYTDAILTALMTGIPVVTAIGNEGNQTTGSPGNDFLAFAVGATDYRDWVAGFSGGRTMILRKSDFIHPELLPLPYLKPDISAPGVAIKSSIPDKKWAVFNGTSMATPHVAGAVALLLSVTAIKAKVGPNERGFLIQDILTGSVEELGESGKNQRFGFGRLDVLRAIGFAQSLGYLVEKKSG